MRKHTLIIFILLLSLEAHAQDMKTVFVNMPDTLTPLLTRVNREDFGDFLESGMAAVVKNRFGETAEMTKLTKDYLYLRETSASAVEMKLLPINDTVRVVCMVRTFNAPRSDSSISFFSTKWERLGEKDFIDEGILSLREKGLVELRLSELSDSLKAVTTRFASLENEDSTYKQQGVQLQKILTETEEASFAWAGGKYVMKHMSED